MKKCFKCGEVKPLTDFYKHPMMADGRLGKCKECNKRDVQENYRKRIDYYREYDRKRAMLPHRVEERKKYAQSEAGKESTKKTHDKYLKNHPVRKGASIIVNNAVRDGRLYKPKECSVCSNGGRLHGHHDDYVYPLEVRWMCPLCHKKWHDKHGSGLNG